MNADYLEALLDELADVVRELVEQKTAPLLQRLAELERQPAAPAPRDGLPGRDGRDGKDGAPGADGLGFDDFSVHYDGERTLTLRFVRGERVREFPVVAPWPLDCGVWRAERAHVRGDGVTHGGSWWIAQRATSAKPGEGNDDWRLSVKKGRDGRDGDKGDKGDPGAAGRAGRDLTNLAPDGSKWA
jgi:integrin beta 3